MRIGVFDAKSFDRRFLSAAAREGEWSYFESRLTPTTAELARGFDVVCCFVHDLLDRSVLERLAEHGTRLVALRCAGFNNVDLTAAKELGLPVVRVPAYSPHAVAEHAVAMMLMLNRRLHRAYNRVREGNFSLEGLLGFDMHGRTAGIIGTGKIGAVVGRILAGFGCRLVVHDVHPNPDLTSLGATYLPLEELWPQADILTLHCPLLPTTRHLINAETVARLKPGVMIINTSRGALVDTASVVNGLKIGKIGYLGLDVYEEEDDLFSRDLSAEVLQDDVFARLLTFPNVLITAHQAYLTLDALEAIARTTVESIAAWRTGQSLIYQL